MEAWSVSFIQSHIIKVKFLPNAYKISKRKQMSWRFQDLSDLYFPESTTVFSRHSEWAVCANSGYLKRYWELIQPMKPEEVILLNQNLKILFGRVQSLPHSSHPKGRSKGKFWGAAGGTIEMLSNSKSYRLTGIISGKGKSVASKPIRVQVHPNEFAARLEEIHGGIPQSSTKKSLTRSKRRNRKKARQTNV